MVMHQLSLQLLGPVRLTVNGQVVESSLWTKSLALLAYVASEHAIVHRREVLAELLWPAKPKGVALTSLRQAISQLHKTIPSLDDYLHITAHTLQFRSECWTCLDAAQFDNLIHLCEQHAHVARSSCGLCVERLEQAVELYRGPFMSGFFLRDAFEFEAWVEMQRHAYEQAAISTLARITDYYLEHDRFEIAQQTALRQIEMDPYFEMAHRQYMQALVASGLRVPAVKHFDHYRDLLERELGFSPEAETELLYERIRWVGLGTSGPATTGYFSWASRLGINTQVRSQPAFVGRKKELTLLQSRFHEALKGNGQIVLVAGEAGWGKTALIDAFAHLIRAAHPNVIPVYGKGNAYFGIGDPYLPFRDLLGFLCGDVETRWTAGVVSQDLVYRVWKLLPVVAKAVLEDGPDLIDVFISGQTLLHRVKVMFADNQRQEPDWVEHLQGLVERSAAQTIPQPAAIQKHLFEQYARVMARIADQAPLILVLDDMQWMDAGSVSLLFHLNKRLTNSCILLIGAYRPLDLRGVPYSADSLNALDGGPLEANVPQRHPLEYVLNELKRDGGNIEILLSQGEEGFTDALINCYPNALGESFRAEFEKRTQGHPLTAVELLENMLTGGGLVKDRFGRLVEGELLDWEILPARIEALIKERLGRLPRRLLTVLHAASVEGEHFTAEIIAEALKIDDQEIIRILSDEIANEYRLISSESIQWQQDGQRLSRYRFDHILFQRYLYSSLGTFEQARWHASIASAIEKLLGDHAAQEAVRLSWHYQRAGNQWKAVHYLNMAGERAMRLSANQEAMAYFVRALDVLGMLPDASVKANLELALQINLAVSIGYLKGYADAKAGEALTRAYELCKQTGDAQRAFPVLWQLALHRSSLADFAGGAVMMQELLGLGEQIEDPLMIVLGHWGMGWSDFWTGKHPSSQQHLAEVIAFYDPERHKNLAYIYSQDPGATSHAIGALNLLLLGYPDQAAQAAALAVELARRINHQHTLALTLAYTGMMIGFASHYAQLLETGKELVEVTRKNEFVYWHSASLSLHGWALYHLGRVREGLQEMWQSLDLLQVTGTSAGREALCIALAEALANQGKAAEALQLIENQIIASQKAGAMFCMPEQIRVRAEALLRLRPPQETLAEAAFLESIDLARSQSTLFLELKSALSLARLWQRQGKGQQAWSLLAPVYARFTEGFDLPALKAARQLLLELEQRQSPLSASV